MEKTRLYAAYLTLSASERRQFAKMLVSPFFNPPTGASDLMNYLQACAEKKTRPDTETAWAVAFPGKRYQDAHMRLFNSRLLSLLEHFFEYQAHFNAQNRNWAAIPAVYRQRKLPKHFQTAMREARAHQEAIPWQDERGFDLLYRLEWEQYQFDAASRRSETLNLQQLSDALDAGFLIQKLRLACLAQSHQAVYKTEYHLGLIPEIVSLAFRRLDEPAIALYFHCYHFQAENDALAHFTQFTELLFEHSEKLPVEEKRTLHLLALNFGIKRINRAEEGWLNLTFDLYKSALEHGILLENKHLSRFAFNNIVAIALRAGALEWAENFIYQYKPMLERQFREAGADLNLARVAYARKNFSAALQHLQRADYKDLMNNLTAKTLQLKIFYETEAFDLLESHLTSMQAFIRRHTAMGYHRDNYSKVLHYTRLLMQLPPGRTPARQTLRNQLENEQSLSEKNWLMEQLEK